MPRGRKPTHAYSRTLGGEKLRALRQRAKLTLLDLEAATDFQIGTAHIHKIEVGMIKRPDPETLNIMLIALDASFIDRRDVLEAFGYTTPVYLPTEEEIDEARILCTHELHDATYPIYLIDIGQRLLAWNRYVPRLIGMHPDDPSLVQFVGVTVFDLAFNPTYPVKHLIDNPDEYLPAMLKFIKTGLEPFREESWYATLLAQARELPGFSEIWDSLDADAYERYTNWSIIPVRIKLQHAGVIQFRVSSSDLLIDPRFRIVHFTPFGATALRQCAIWAEEEGIL